MMHATLDEPIRHHYSTLPQDREPRLAPGTRALGGQLQVIGELARGGMAIVYRAIDHRRGGTEVALKVANADADPKEMAGRFRNEARLAGSLAGHPSFVRPLQVGELDGPAGFEGRTYLVTELLVGVPLDDVMARHHTGLPTRRACTIARGVARALAHLHARGIVHRDVKPGNIVVSGKDDEEHACLIDFGLAFATGDGWEARSPDLTTDGHAPGTPLYMSPQQLAHQRPAPAFDVYSLGVMLYELFSGSPPNDRIPLGELIARKCDPQRVPFPIGKLCIELPTRLADLVGQCMSFEPSERPTAAEVVEVLDEFLHEGDAAAVAPVAVAAVEPAAMEAVSPAIVPASPAVPEPRRARGWMLAAGVAMLGVLAYALWPSPSLPRDAPSTTVEPAVPASAAYVHAGASSDSADVKAAEPEPVAPVEPDLPASTTAAQPEQPPEPLESAPGRPPRSKPPQAAEPKADRCAEDVREAQEAAADRQWDRVLRLTKKARCWAGASNERMRLRTQALFETKRYAECAKQGQRSSDGDVARMAAVCKAWAQEEGSTP